jgi:hypothetical protein
MIDATSGATTEPSFRCTRKSVPCTVVGRTGQLNSIGSPSQNCTSQP